MLLDYKLGQGSIIIRVKIRNSAVTTGAGLTGLTFSSTGLIISTIADNEVSATAYTASGSTIETIATLGTYAAPTATKCRFKEVESTNHKGIYEIQIADARFAVSNAKSLLISISGAANAAECDVVIPLRQVNPYDAAAFGMSNLNATISSRSTYNGSDTPGTTSLLGYLSVWTGTAQGGGASTITLDAGASATTSLYKGLNVQIVSGTGAGQVRTVTSYNGTTKVATVDFAWAVVPDNTSVFVLLATADAARNSTLQVATNNAQVTINNGVVVAATSTTLTLASSASTTDGIYVGNTVVISNGTGVGQSRYIVAYNGSTRTVTVDRAWITTPIASGSSYSVFASTSANYFSDQGTAQAGGASTITLASTASSVDNTYNGSLVSLLSGTGAGQTGEISSYVGSTRVATISAPWAIVPDTTTAYAVIPSQSHSDSTSTLTAADVTQAVWGSLVNIYTPGQAGYILASIVSGVILAANGLDGVAAESGANIRQAIALILDAVLAKLSGVPPDGVAGSITIRDTGDTVNRATIGVDGNGNRTSSVLNPPA